MTGPPGEKPLTRPLREDGTVAAGSHSWVVLTGVFALATFLEVGVVAHMVLFTPAFLHTIGFSERSIEAWAGPMSAAAFLVGVWFVPFWGVLADRHGRKPLILRSYGIEVLAMVLAALSRNVWLYLAARALTGLALGNTGLMYAALAEVAPKNRLALALGLINGSAPLGSLIGGMAGGLIVSRWGVHRLFALDAAVTGVTAVLLFTLYRENFVPRATPPIRSMLADAVRAVTHTPVAASIFLVSFISNTASFLALPYLPVRIGELVGQDAAPLSIGINQGIAGAATLAGSALWGLLADRAGHRRLVILLMSASTVLWLPIWAASGFATFAAAWAASSLVGPSITSLMFTIVTLSVPAEKRGAIMSMIYLPLNFGFIVGPFAASLVARRFEVRDVFLASSLVSAIALGAFVLSGRSRAGSRTAQA